MVGTSSRPAAPLPCRTRWDACLCAWLELPNGTYQVTAHYLRTEEDEEDEPDDTPDDAPDDAPGRA